MCFSCCFAKLRLFPEAKVEDAQGNYDAGDRFLVKVRDYARSHSTVTRTSDVTTATVYFQRVVQACGTDGQLTSLKKRAYEAMAQVEGYVTVERNQDWITQCVSNAQACIASGARAFSASGQRVVVRQTFSEEEQGNIVESRLFAQADNFIRLFNECTHSVGEMSSFAELVGATTGEVEVTTLLGVDPNFNQRVAAFEARIEEFKHRKDFGDARDQEGLALKRELNDLDSQLDPKKIGQRLNNILGQNTTALDDILGVNKPRETVERTPTFTSKSKKPNPSSLGSSRPAQQRERDAKNKTTTKGSGESERDPLLAQGASANSSQRKTTLQSLLGRAGNLVGGATKFRQEATKAKK